MCKYKYSYLCVFKTHTCKYICIPHIQCDAYEYSYKLSKYSHWLIPQTHKHLKTLQCGQFCHCSPAFGRATKFKGRINWVVYGTAFGMATRPGSPAFGTATKSKGPFPKPATRDGSFDGGVTGWEWLDDSMMYAGSLRVTPTTVALEPDWEDTETNWSYQRDHN